MPDMINAKRQREGQPDKVRTCTRSGSAGSGAWNDDTLVRNIDARAGTHPTEDPRLTFEQIERSHTSQSTSSSTHTKESNVWSQKFAREIV